MDSVSLLLIAGDNLSDTSAFCLIIGLLILTALLYRIAQRPSAGRPAKKRADDRNRSQTAEEGQLMVNITSAGHSLYPSFVDGEVIMQRHAGSDHYTDIKEDLWIATLVGKDTGHTGKEMRLRESDIGTRVEALRSLCEELSREKDEELRKEFVRMGVRFFVAESRAEYEAVIRRGAGE